MTTHEHQMVSALLAPMALGAVTERERARVETHAAECAVCREELGLLQEGADVLALSVTPLNPPRALKRALMSTVRAEAAARVPADAPARPRPPASPSLRARLASLRPWPALTAIATSLALLLVGWNIGLQSLQPGEPTDQREVIAVSASGSQGIEARVLYIPNEDTATVSVSGLRPPGEGMGYELWIIQDGETRSARFLQAQGPAEAIGVASRVRGAEALAVTREALSHDRSGPTTPILVRIPLPA